jgi:hypothetical protein
VADVVADLLQRLLGCEWGRGLCLPEDREPCPAMAAVQVALHGDGAPRLFRLCSKHFTTVQRETDPHREPVAPG